MSLMTFPYCVVPPSIARISWTVSHASAPMTSVSRIAIFLTFALPVVMPCRVAFRDTVIILAPNDNECALPSPAPLFFTPTHPQHTCACALCPSASALTCQRPTRRCTNVPARANTPPGHKRQSAPYVSMHPHQHTTMQ